MTHRRTTVVALFLAALIGGHGFVTDVAAGPKTPAERQNEREQRRKERQERREERRKERKERSNERQQRRNERREAWKKKGKQWRERRRAARKAFLAKWGHIHKRPAVRAELRKHAWRMARLQRLRALAVEASRDDLVKRADALMAKEQARHQRRMSRLKGTSP